ncbi:MAG: glycerol ethanol, ferric requiring protein [Chrysothrix sp. TS-e1954]|nr:MAG: glycerol ethanol, ferric requiring protein [Chrysothrix sp. TS-e1954]
MAIGASFGRMVGILVEALHEANPSSRFFAACQPDVPCITPGTYAFLGAGAALSGIMHITVSVVVIMFELTGALDYILPTMIVVGITKAVGDRFGHGGIADRMIWFNGFPFLDNKESHSFGVPVSKVMTPASSTIALPASGATLREVERILSKTSYQGFPIVEDAQSNILLGYIGRTELRYAVDRAQRDSFVPAHAICVFHGSAANLASNSGPTPLTPAGPVVSFPLPSNTSTTPSTANPQTMPHIDLTRFPTSTPLTVHPSLPLETALELFKKLGPRVILVEYRGTLAGLVTVKDCLKYQFKAEAQQSGATPGTGGESQSMLAAQERLWSPIRRVAGWIGSRVERASWGRVRLGEGMHVSSTSRRQRVDRSEYERVHLGDDEGNETTEAVVRGEDGLAVEDPELELEERFPGGGTGSS